MKTQMLHSFKGQNMHLKGGTFEDNDANFLFYEVVNSIEWGMKCLVLIFSMLPILASKLALHLY